MKVIRNICIGLFIGILIIGGFFFYSYSDVLGINIIAPSTEKYVRQAIMFMDNQGVYNQSEEWIKVKEEVLEETKNCRSYEECYPYLEKAIKTVGGKHSKLIPYNEIDSTKTCDYPDMEYLEQDILYIHLPAFLGNGDEANQYATMVYEFIREHPNIKGVIIDLQHNTGGDMGPMVASISCFLPDGELMAFDNHGVRQSVILDQGTVTGGGSSVTMNNPFKIESIPIAILQDEYTASSAEATLLCFRGLDNVKTFGSGSAGYCSCNNIRKLYDGTILQLTIGSDVARTDEFFLEDPIQPDVDTDNPKEDALEWLIHQKGK